MSFRDRTPRPQGHGSERPSSSGHLRVRRVAGPQARLHSSGQGHGRLPYPGCCDRRCADDFSTPVFTSFVHILRSGAAGSCDEPPGSFLRTLQTVSMAATPFSISASSAVLGLSVLTVAIRMGVRWSLLWGPTPRPKSLGCGFHSMCRQRVRASPQT